MQQSFRQPQPEYKQTGVCPFDKNHIIDPAKLLKHIKKCKSPTRRDFDECPFNPYHWVNFQELEQHKLECPNRNSSFVDEYPQTHNQSFQSNRSSNSFISDIHEAELTSDNMEMFKIGIDFEIHKPAFNQISSFSKRINKEEMGQLNVDKLFK